MFDYGALLGLISVIVLSFIILKVRKKKAIRGWKKYGDEQIYRPDEWERIHRAEWASASSQSEDATAKSGVNTSSSESSDKRNNARPSNIQDKPNTSITRSNKATKRIRITIPNIEPFD